MKAEEIMIGDWVISFGAPHKIVGVRTDTPYPYIKTNMSDTWYEEGMEGLLEPIPLTREILKKNGWKYEFDKKKYMVRYDLGKEGKDCWMMWSIDEKTLDLQRQDEDLRNIYNLCVQRVVIPCNYVHELQHALRLAGIDKEIVL